MTILKTGDYLKKFEERLKLFKPRPQDQHSAEGQQRRLLNQLAYLTKLHKFLEKSEKIKPEKLDDLHRELFKETPFKLRSFRNRVGRIVSSSKKIYELLLKYELDSPIRKAVAEMREFDYKSLWMEELNKIDKTLVPIDEKKYVPKISKEVLLKAFGAYEKHFVVTRSWVAEKGLRVLIDASETLRHLGHEYGSALAKEGIIKSREFGTPFPIDIVCRIIVCTCGIAALTHDIYKSKETSSIFYGLGLAASAII